jgi:hypothetical protein
MHECALSLSGIKHPATRIRWFAPLCLPQFDAPLWTPAGYLLTHLHDKQLLLSSKDKDNAESRRATYCIAVRQPIRKSDSDLL